MPFFSIIIPTYNRQALLAAALKSVFAQMFSDYEIVAVDDGSTDGTQGYLASLDGRVRVLAQTNRGPGSARNLGVHHAAGQYLVFLDSDDVLFPWTLESYRQVIEKTQRPAFIAGKPFRFHDQKQLKTVAGDVVRMLEFPDYLASGDQWRWWGASSFVMRKDAFDHAGGFTDAWINGEDADLALRLGEARGFVQITAPFTFGYRDHSISAMKNSERTLAGARYQIAAEKAGAYFGGPERALQRWLILTRHIRPVSIDCLRQGMRREAWELYRETFRWHVRLKNWKYLAGFPLKALSLSR